VNPLLLVKLDGRKIILDLDRIISIEESEEADVTVVTIASQDKNIVVHVRESVEQIVQAITT
jgi:uncharacterized protein YlzI (FlbEa/FlbD family)